MRDLSRRHPRARARAGFTLIELVISLVLLGLVMGTVIQLLTRQQRFYRGASSVMDMRNQLRQAVYVLPADLRGIHPAGGDVIDWTSSSITFRAVSGSSILCSAPTATTLVLPPIKLTQQNTLSTWHTLPVVGDSILVYDENLEVGSSDDVWRRHIITSVSTVTGVGACTEVSGYTLIGDSTEPSYQLLISPALTTTTMVGAPIRVFRQTTYELYQAADSRWYLGVSDCLPGRIPECSSLSPVSGPYRPLSASADSSGLYFRYYDVAGTELDPATASSTAIARIQIVVRGEADTPKITGAPSEQYQDSLSFTVGLRNR